MKRRLLLPIVLVVLISSGLASARGASQGPATDRVPAGFHEFEMFGGTSVFLSHYPMFGSVHAYQVLLEARVTGHGNDPWKLYLDYKKAHPAARFSVSPETPDGGNDYWAMPDVIKVGKTFRATIHTEPDRGKPVFIRHRTAEEIKSAEAVDVASLKDRFARNQSLKDGTDADDKNRVDAKHPQWLVLVGVCTHLGCIPKGQSIGDVKGDYGGWFCPCHGSQYDTSGRIRKGPAPENLPVPPYAFLSDTKIKIG